MLLIWSLGHSEVTNFQHKMYYKYKMLNYLKFGIEEYQLIKKIL